MAMNKKPIPLKMSGFQEIKNPAPKKNGLYYSNVKKVVGIVSGKGGVGKSLITSLLACATNKKGYKTAIIDADITGPSIAKSFGVTGKTTLSSKGILPVTTDCGIKLMSINFLLDNQSDAVLWRGPLLNGAIKQFYEDVYWGDVDIMFLDMPPGTADIPLTVYQLIKPSGVVMVTTPQDLVSMIVAKAVTMAEKMSIDILGLIENMSYYQCPDTNNKHKIFGESNIDAFAKQIGVDVLSKIAITPKFAQYCDNGKISEIDDNPLDDIVDKIINDI